MEINSDLLSVGKMPITAATSIFASTLLWAFFFGLTGIGANDLFTFKLHIILGKALTTNMLLFLLTFSLPIALMAAFAKRMEKANLIIFSIFPSILALIIAMAVFQQLQSLWIIAVFYLVAVPLVIENASVKYLELKRRITARTMWSATGRAIALISIGLIALSALTIIPGHEQYLERFEEFFMDFAHGITSGQNQETISSGAADIFIAAQVKTLDQVVEDPSFEKLRGKTDPDVIEFVATADIIADYFKSPEYAQEIEETFREGTSSIVEEIDIMEMIKEYFPFIQLLESIMPLGIWLGLMHAIALAGLFSFAGFLFCKTTAVAYGLAADQTLKRLDRPSQDIETGQELKIEQDF
jgi:hypothetical protein